MADIFLSFATADTERVKIVRDAFRSRGLSVFWSNDIPKGAPNYQDVIIEEIRKAPAVVVLWTLNSVASQPVAQECDQAKRDGKLFQVVLDDIEPIRFPFAAGHLAQKTLLQGWNGNLKSSEWAKLNDAIDSRVKRANAVKSGSKSSNERELPKSVIDFIDAINNALDEYFMLHKKTRFEVVAPPDPLFLILGTSANTANALSQKLNLAIQDANALWDGVMPCPLTDGTENELWPFFSRFVRDPSLIGLRELKGIDIFVQVGRVIGHEW